MTKSPENGVFRAENDILGLNSSSPIEMKLVDLFLDFVPFLVIFGHFGSQVTFLWVPVLGARATPSPNFSMGFVSGTQGPHKYQDGVGSGRPLAGVPWLYLIAHWDPPKKSDPVVDLGPRRAAPLDPPTGGPKCLLVPIREGGGARA